MEAGWPGYSGILATIGIISLAKVGALYYCRYILVYLDHYI